MSKLITIEEPMIVEDNGGSVFYLPVRMNNHNVAIPILKSTSTMALLAPTLQMNMVGSTLYTVDEGVSSYRLPDDSALGVAFEMGGKKYAFPIYQIPQSPDDVVTMTFNNPTTVTDIHAIYGETGKPKLLVFSIDDINFGVPLLEYDSVFDLKTNKRIPAKPPTPLDPENPTEEEEKAIRDFKEPPVDTMLGIGKPTLDIGPGYGSTYVNSKIVAYSDLIKRIKKYYGFPTVQLEICDEEIGEFIDQSIEMYTKFAGWTQEWLVFKSQLYEPGVGVRLDKLYSVTPHMYKKNRENGKDPFDYDLNQYRKVINVLRFEYGQATGVNTLFTIEQSMAQQTYFHYILGSYGFDLVTWNSVKHWLDTREKMLAQTPYPDFNPQTQYFNIIPDPQPGQEFTGLVECVVCKPIRELIMEPWICKYATALVGIAIGNVRTKYTYTMMGGVTIHGDQVLSSAIEERKSLEEQLYKGQGFVDSPQAFIIT